MINQKVTHIKFINYIRYFPKFIILMGVFLYGFAGILPDGLAQVAVDEDIEIVEEIKPKRKPSARKTQKRDAVVYDSQGEEPEPKKAPRKKPVGKKKQPALIKRALETQDKIEEEKAAPEPSIQEEKTPKPKREKVVQNWDML